MPVNSLSYSDQQLSRWYAMGGRIAGCSSCYVITFGYGDLLMMPVRTGGQPWLIGWPREEQGSAEEQLL